MNNFELIDDFLTGKLSEQEQNAFEQQLKNDPALKSEVELQKEIIKGLKAARAAELKSMLDKVVVSSPTIYFTPLRIAAGFIGATVLATSLYFYFGKEKQFNTTEFSSSIVDSIQQSEKKEIKVEKDSVPIEESTIKEQPVKKDSPPKARSEESTEAIEKTDRPSIDLIDPTDELVKDDGVTTKSESVSNSISVAKIDIDVINTERKFKSHYQFKNGRLMLYGNFDNGLYEIIEVNGDRDKSLFFNYKTSYYLLDESKKEITPLKEITDPILIQKLKAFQSK